MKTTIKTGIGATIVAAHVILTQNSTEMINVKIRYKEPKENRSKLLEFPVKDRKLPLASTSDNFRFSASVAQFGMLLRDSKFKGKYNFAQVKDLAKNVKGNDTGGYREEFVKLIDDAKKLQGKAER